VGELDNRGSHFYLAFYWAEALAAQSEDAELKTAFGPVAEALSSNETQILEELNGIQGGAVELSGYFRPEAAKASASMRPSGTLNKIIDAI